LRAGGTETFGRTAAVSGAGGTVVSPLWKERQGGLGANGEQVLLRIEQKSCEGRRRPGGFAVRERQGQRRLQVAHVADLTCLHCAEKQAELERKAEIIETLQVQLNESMAKEHGALAAAQAAGNALIAAKAQITREQKRSVKAGQVQQVVDHWRLLRPRTGPEFGEPGSKSFAVIEKALVLMASDPAGAVAACCEAIDGLHMAPWMSYGKRYATPGEGRVLRRDLEHALGDEQRIQKCRQILRWLRAGGAQRAWEIYQAVQETEQVLRAEVMDLLGEQRFRREEPADWYFVEVGGVRTRVSEKTEKATREGSP
jgi:hypothetical protein